MGDVHVHAAPHAYEANGYGLWALGDNTFSAVYFGLACAELAVASYMLKRRSSLPWRECGGGNSWWRRKFIFLSLLIPLPLIRSFNLYIWATFNSEAGSGQGDLAYEKVHYDQVSDEIVMKVVGKPYQNTVKNLIKYGPKKINQLKI